EHHPKSEAHGVPPRGRRAGGIGVGLEDRRYPGSVALREEERDDEQHGEQERDAADAFTGSPDENEERDRDQGEEAASGEGGDDRGGQETHDGQQDALFE